VLLIDLDNFKSINDRFGHAFGDRVLQIFASTARGAVRSSDFVGRLGGEEFAVVLHGLAGERALVVAERIRNAFAEEAEVIEGHTVGATLSVGLAIYDGSTIGFHRIAVEGRPRALPRQGGGAQPGCHGGPGFLHPRAGRSGVARPRSPQPGRWFSGEDAAPSCVPGFSSGAPTSLRAFAQKSINFEDYAAMWSIGHGSPPRGPGVNREKPYERAHPSRCPAARERPRRGALRLRARAGAKLSDTSGARDRRLCTGRCDRCPDPPDRG